ncbi:hypothetical protein NL676_009236 [Syzygium grande]|nr:hypothetical protein NL676_009236 [Syzygium grande]
MGVVIIDGTTVRSFVADEQQFKKSVDEKFAALDVNGDGVLSRSELRRAFESMRLIESDFGVDVATPPQELTALYDSIFERFDGDGSGAVDLEEFRSEMRAIMLAIADGLGSSPHPDGDRGRRPQLPQARRRPRGLEARRRRRRRRRRQVVSAPVSAGR